MDRDKIEDKLLQLGITPNLRGFNYLASAIATYQFDMPMMEVYTAVAEEYSTEPSRVERCIRHAKDKCEQYVKTANSEFIALISIEIKRIKSAEEREESLKKPEEIVINGFAEACEPLMRYLSQCHPNVKAVVSSNIAEMISNGDSYTFVLGKQYEKAPTITEAATSDVDASSITQGKGTSNLINCQGGVGGGE